MNDKTSEEQNAEPNLDHGRDLDGAALMKRELTRLCGGLPDDADEEIGRLAPHLSQIFGEALGDFQSLEAMQSWLKNEVRPDLERLVEREESKPKRNKK